MEIQELKENTYELLRGVSPDTLTSQEICVKLGVNDETVISSILARLELEKKIKEDDYKKIYREDGGVIVIPKYRSATENDFY